MTAPVGAVDSATADKPSNELEQIRALALDILQFDRNHAIEGDARARGVRANTGMISVQVDMMTGSTKDIFNMQPREARVLAAQLLRAADTAELLEADGSKRAALRDGRPTRVVEVFCEAPDAP